MYYKLGISTPISVLFRTLILGMVVLTLLKNRNFKKRGFLALSVSLLALAIWTVIYNASLVFEISYLIRLFYIPIIMIFFVENTKYYDKPQLYQYIINYGIVISMIIIVTFVLGVGNYSYGEGEYGFGMKGFFKAGNDLSMTIVFCLCFSIIYYLKYESSFFNIAKCVSISLGGVLIGSRVGMVLCPIILGCFMLYLFLFSRAIPFIIRSLLLAALVLFSFRMAFCVLDQLDSYALARFEMDNIESARTLLTDGAQKHIDSYDGIDLIVGRGDQALLSSVANDMGLDISERDVEADWYELIGSCGYGLGWLYLFIYYLFSFNCLKCFVKKRNMEAFVVFMLSLMFIIIGYLAGHAIKNVMVAPLMGVVAYVTYNRSRIIYTNNNSPIYEEGSQYQ